MTPEREAQMREMFEKWKRAYAVNTAFALGESPSKDEIAKAAWDACARALEPMVRDGERMRWLLDGNGFFMEEQGLCGYAPCSDEEKNAARDEIDAAMSAALEEEKNANQ